jgi:hypothetical protein
MDEPARAQLQNAIIACHAYMANPYEPLHEGLPRAGAGVPVAQPVATVVAMPVAPARGQAAQRFFADAWDGADAELGGAGVAARRDWRGGLFQCAGACRGAPRALQPYATGALAPRAR